jgi:hypothetical protein
VSFFNEDAWTRGSAAVLSQRKPATALTLYGPRPRPIHLAPVRAPAKGLFGPLDNLIMEPRHKLLSDHLAFASAALRARMWSA